MKQKQKLLKALLITPVLVGLLSLPIPANAANWFTSLLGGLGEVLLSLIGTILALIMGVIANVIFPFIYGLIDMMVVNENIFLVANSDPGSPSQIMQTVWGFSLDLANSIFLIVLVMAAIAIILRINTGIYNIKKVLSGLIVAIILSNLSLLIVKTILTIASQLTTSILALFGSNPQSASYLIRDIYIAVSNPGERFLTFGVGQIVFLAFLVILFLIIFKIAWVLLQRTIWIFILIISAPIAFALSLLPATQKYASQWWATLFRWILVYPLMVLVLVIAGKILTSVGSVGTLFSWTSPLDPTELNTINPDVMVAIIGLTVLFFAGQVDKIISLGATGFGGIYKTVADTATGKNATGKFARSQYDRGKRELMAGTFDKIPGGKSLKEKSINLQTWWERNKTLNPTARKDDLEGKKDKALSAAYINADFRKVQENLKPLNEASQSTYGKDWYDLNKEQQEAIKTDPKLKQNDDRLKEARKSMIKKARKSIKDTDSADFDPVSMLEEDLISNLGKDKSEDKGIVAAVTLAKIAAQKGNAEKGIAARTLKSHKEILKQYGIDPKQILKKDTDDNGEPFDEELSSRDKTVDLSDMDLDSSSSSDLRLINAEKQKASAEKKINETSQELSALGISRKTAQKIVNDVTPPDSGILSKIKDTTLNKLKGVNKNTPNKLTIIQDATKTKDANGNLVIDSDEADTILDMLDEDMTVEEIKGNKIGKNKLDSLLKQINSSEEIKKESEKEILETKEIHREEKTRVQQNIKANIKTENRQKILTDVKVEYDNVIKKVFEQPEVETLGELGLPLTEQENIVKTVDNVGIKFVQDNTSDIPIRDVLKNLRLIKDSLEEGE